MTPKKLTPKKALNKAFLKVKPSRIEIERFKTNLIALLDRTNDSESEEFHKNLVIDFLKKTYYDPEHFINTKGRNDLVIHNGSHTNSTVGVIIEAKKPTNKSEMISIQKLNSKAFQELLLYYLRERISHKNLAIKHLVATNIYEWFVFDATLFDRLFAQNKMLINQFNDFEAGRLADSKTDFFYKQIAEPFINSLLTEIEYTYFHIQDFQKPLHKSDQTDDQSLISLFKLLSPEHLLKLPFSNDSNSLDKRFYNELLHIIGLTETKEGSKKLIERNKEGHRHSGTILEDAIIQLDSLDKLNRLEKPGQFGNTQSERLFAVSLELTITWINRILFLKLLEAQLITYHKGDQSYAFLNLNKIKTYDDLNSLFFQVLARKFDERNEDVKKVFEKIPYLNSSLFEPTDIEQLTIFISNLKDDKTIPIHPQTVLKDQQGKKRSGQIITLQYLFEFLDAYDFGAEGGSLIQEDNKTLINASVLGLIFEKINGYKDGSFFTPGFITMYMCRETIRKAVLQKFNESLNQTPLWRGAGGVSANPGQTNITPKREIIPYNPTLKELARELRNNSTKAEIILWKHLKGKFEGKYDFHRQKPLDNYIADFFCHELKLVIEIDGETHSWEETQQMDFEKECRFNELGLNVLRFSDVEIFKHLETTLDSIKQYVAGFEKGDLSAFLHEDTPLNPLSRGDFQLTAPYIEQPPNKWFNNLDDVYEQIGEGRLFTRQQANNIVNSLKICDPAVGSGHFLVSALNEMIAVKNDLKILQDRSGKRLKEYQVEVVNDELIVTDEDGIIFEYNPANKESQRIQETLFHEKQTIIENCLFGVDINANSVKICRLRLWIELLKNAYYKNATELETLPNIDINIKCGNSLVSRFAIDADLKQTLRKNKWTIDGYRNAVDTYRNAENKEHKRAMENLIADIKSDFRSEISLNDPKVIKHRKLRDELFKLTNQGQLFKLSKKEKTDWNKKVQKLSDEIGKLEIEIEAIKANKIFENAFEWRFEFPEILDDEGNFLGFDVVIGNPPYGATFNNQEKNYIKHFYKSYKYKFDSYVYFIELGLILLKPGGVIEFITPILWLSLDNCLPIRNIIIKDNNLKRILIHGESAFEEAVVNTLSFQIEKNRPENELLIITATNSFTTNKFDYIDDKTLKIDFKMNIVEKAIVNKIKSNSSFLSLFGDVIQGITPYDSYSGQTQEIIRNKAYHFDFEKDKTCGKWLDGKNLNRYSIKWDNKWLSYGDWLAAPREERFFTGPRILFREAPGKGRRIQASLTNEKYFYGHSISPFKPFNEFINEIDFILGVINSKLISWYGNLILPNFGKEIFPKLNPNDIKELPIANSNNGSREKIKSNVQEILKIKSQDHSADTSDLESQIDQLVYKLYDLTEEEIKIIEAS